MASAFLSVKTEALAFSYLSFSKAILIILALSNLYLLVKVSNSFNSLSLKRTSTRLFLGFSTLGLPIFFVSLIVDRTYSSFLLSVRIISILLSRTESQGIFWKLTS